MSTSITTIAINTRITTVALAMYKMMIDLSEIGRVCKRCTPGPSCVYRRRLFVANS